METSNKNSYLRKLLQGASILGIVVIVILSAKGFFSLQQREAPTTGTRVTQGELLEGYTIKNGVVYFKNKEVQGADSGTFTIFSKKVINSFGDVYLLAKDSTSIYYNGEKVSGDYDVSSLQYVDYLSQGNSAFKDSRNVYLGFFSGGGSSLEKIKDADPKSFVILRNECENIRNEPVLFAKDNNHVYCGTEMLQSADPATFEIVGEKTVDLGTRGYSFAYSKDSKHVYKANQIVEGADPALCVASNVSGCETMK